MKMNVYTIAAITTTVAFLAIGTVAASAATRKGTSFSSELGNMVGLASGRVPDPGNPDSYIDYVRPFAEEVERQYGIPAEVAIAQSALESGWGKSVKGNAFFGVKTSGQWSGQKTCFTTTEYYSKSDWESWAKNYHKSQGPVEVFQDTGDQVGVKVKDCFRKYGSPLDSFMGWAQFLVDNPRYSQALQNTDNPYKFADEIAAAGYATAPNYASSLKSTISTVNQKLST